MPVRGDQDLQLLSGIVDRQQALDELTDLSLLVVGGDRDRDEGPVVVVDDGCGRRPPDAAEQPEHDRVPGVRVQE